MISVTSVTDNYILQPLLIAKHKRTLEWISVTKFWKRELAFFQKLLDAHALRFTTEDDKKQVDHFQSIILYYKNELIDSFKTRLRLHEKCLATMLETHDESDIRYFKEHDQLMSDMESVNRQLTIYKGEFFGFIEKAM
jgi:hypothetical protein